MKLLVNFDNEPKCFGGKQDRCWYDPKSWTGSVDTDIAHVRYSLIQFYGNKKLQMKLEVTYNEREKKKRQNTR